MKQHYDIAVIGGGPVARQLKKLTNDNLLIVGDAARLTDPITGAGIVDASISGVYAGETAAEAIQKKRYDKKFLEKYSRRWNKTLGDKLKINYKIKNFILKMDDKQLCRINELASKIPEDKMTLVKFLKLIIKNNPKLLAEFSKAVFLK
jgi:digeranylgeranylglycerophospholipid reductase